MEKNEQNKNKFEEKQPTLDKSIKISKDGKWVIMKTIRTDIMHVNYIQAILRNGGAK